MIQLTDFKVVKLHIKSSANLVEDKARKKRCQYLNLLSKEKVAIKKYASENRVASAVKKSAIRI